MGGRWGFGGHCRFVGGVVRVLPLVGTAFPLSGGLEVPKGTAFGSHGGVLSVTDGQYVYMVAPVADHPQCYDYTLMPTHMRARFSVAEMQQATLAEPFGFTKNCPVLKIPAPVKTMSADLPEGQTALYDVIADPQQKERILDKEVEARMRSALIDLLKENEAPEEYYAIYGLN